MKNKALIKYLALTSMLFLFLGLGSACKNGGNSAGSGGKLPPLEMPENVCLLLNQTEDGETEFIVDWDKVKGAYNYNVSINGETISVIGSKCDVTEYVNVGKPTTIQVWANGVKGKSSPSPKERLSCTPNEVSEGLFYNEVDGGYQVYGEDNINGKELILPDTYLNKPIIKIEDKAFSRNFKFKDFETVRLPALLNYIGEYAFEGFVKLEELVCPPKLKTIGDCAFMGCERLTSVDLANVENIGGGCFECCDLREVFVPKTVKKLGGLGANVNLTKVVIEDAVNIEYGVEAFCSTGLTAIPENLTIITECMFKECKGLTDVYIPETVKEIGNQAFAYCDNMKSLHIPAKTRFAANIFLYIPDEVEIHLEEGSPYYDSKNGYLISKDGKELVKYFNSNTAESFTVPSTVETIGEYAFFQAKLKQVTLPNGLKVIGEGAFSKTENLKQVTLPNGLKVIGRLAFNESGLTSIDLPDSVEQIGSNAFGWLKGLTTIKFPKGITSLPDGGLFRSSGIKHLDIPDHVTYIGDGAFMYHMSLESLVLHKYITYFSTNGNQAFGVAMGSLSILPNIFFRGTEAEWNEMVQKGILREEFFSNKGRKFPIYFYSEDEPPKTDDGTAYDNNYWRYDENGMPQIWEIQS